jgi:hypothetical protein
MGQAGLLDGSGFVFTRSKVPGARTRRGWLVRPAAPRFVGAAAPPALMMMSGPFQCQIPKREGE